MRVNSSAMMIKSNITPNASSESSQVLWITYYYCPPMEISLIYSSKARLESPTVGIYLITTRWSGCSLGEYRSGLESTTSLTTPPLLISLLLNYLSSIRFFPSLFPRWLYDTMDIGLIPAPTRYSAKRDLSLVCPVLKSSPQMCTWKSSDSSPASFFWYSYSVSSSIPGTNVFWGDPLIKVIPSNKHATANTELGDTSLSHNPGVFMVFSKCSQESLTPDSITL